MRNEISVLRLHHHVVCMGQGRVLPPLLTPETARLLLEGRESVSFDLGLSHTDFHMGEDGVVLPDGSEIGLDDLRRIEGREGAVFFVRDGVILQVAISDGHFYKLVPTDGAPTLEIDGIRMHRTVGTTPDADTRMKLEAVGVLRSGRGLDTCTGLGYSALSALEEGAALVVSTELRHQVLRVAEMNPWSRGLFEDSRLNLILGDAYHVVDALPEGFFDFVIHDPPRISLAGCLYSGDFYLKMKRVLGPGGRGFHYTGEPGSRRRGVDLRRGVMRRLRQVGFVDVSYREEVRGVTFSKPR